jgi:pantoate--beta-alanine ligase
MIVARTKPELDSAIAILGPVNLVPTMGALHEGHLSLLAAARADGRPAAASIFVNPLQFAPTEDFNAYPRDEAGDLAALESAGCALAWLPSVTDIYPPDAASTITVAGPALRWEGAARPTHFAGVATVVAKLFGHVRPAAAFFGEKDWQQIQVISRMTADFHLPVRIIPVPTARAPDGLALSSRNRFLTPQERQTAPILFATLQATAAALRAGGSITATLAAAKARLTNAGLSPDYVACVHPESLEPLETLDGPARLIAAARLGRIRLLDNIPV